MGASAAKEGAALGIRLDNRGSDESCSRATSTCQMNWLDKVDWYRIKTAHIGLKRLATLPEEDKQACNDANGFFQRMQAGEETETKDESG